MLIEIILENLYRLRNDILFFKLKEVFRFFFYIVEIFLLFWRLVKLFNVVKRIM